MPREKKVYKYNFLYKTTNIKNGKFYIGMHSTDNLDDGYFGSGNRIRSSIRHHGKEVHIREILEFFDNRDSLAGREKEVVNVELIKNPLCMNLMPGGYGGYCHENPGGDCFNYVNTIYWNLPENKERIRKLVSEANTKNWNNINSEKKEERLKNLNFDGKSHTNESKKLIGIKNSILQKGEKNSQFGKIWITKNNEDKKISQSELENYTKDGWLRGRRGGSSVG